MRLNVIGTLSILCLLLCACTRETPPSKPKFKGRLLLLVGDPTTERNLLELTSGPNDAFNNTTVASGVFEAAANPDRTALLYATQDEIVLRDLRTGDVKSLVKGHCFCLAWSPDGKRFSYKLRGAGIGLYASDLDGHAQLIWEDVRGDKRHPNQTTFVPLVDVGCAFWVAPDKLIFDRFGPSQKIGPDAKPNTITLAILNDAVRLMDTEKKWSVEGICKSGTAFLRSPEGEILIAKNLENPKTANPTSGPCSGCRFLGFAAQSCVPFFIEENARDSSDLFYLNPTNWQRQRAAHIGQTFSPAARMLINSSTRLMVVGDAPGFLLLVDTESGEVTPLLGKSDAPLTSPVPVVWIEK